MEDEVIQSRQLEAFRAVMLTGGMTSAADLVRITQPAISRLIKDLEEETGLRLFDRIGNRLRPTREAGILFKEVSRHFNGIQHIDKVAAELKKSHMGSLRVACYTAPSLSFMSGVIQTFIGDRPDVSVYLDTVPSQTVLELVSLQHYDLGISILASDYPGLRVEPVPSFRAVCLLPPGHVLESKDVVHAKDLEGTDLICLSPVSLLRMQIDSVLDSFNVHCGRRIESGLALSVCDLVSKGMGIGIVDPFTADYYCANPVVRRPFEPVIPYHFAIVLPSGSPPPRLVTEFQTVLFEALGKLPYETV
ncbi:LysR family transcriptional regulator [Agrobacterium larrymoorei]|uniref:LysR family transcriptional regulator n=1 Tax=Agrobacterium larrymoorei TaxID=160699 RepID=A0A4D7E149_9HYPH|nr:LysR family transcriptional regulator [Agrobacterium larrymoorei]QCJ01020.1 LysR family transcriptional regulator [Agrobacterium larrymoorei]